MSRAARLGVAFLLALLGGCGTRSAPPDAAVVPAEPATAARYPMAVSAPILDAWTKAGAKWCWFGQHTSSGEFRFTHDPSELEVATAISALKLDDQVAEGVLAKLPAPDRPIAVRMGRFGFGSHPGKQSRLLREITAHATVKAVRLECLDPATVSIVASTVGLESVLFEAIPLEISGEPDYGQLRWLTNLKVLTLEVGDRPAGDFGWLAGLTELRHLRIPHNPLTDSGAEAVGKLTHLTRLDIDADKLSPAGWTRLVGLTHLRALTLHLGPNRPNGLDLSRFPNLTKLTLTGRGADDTFVAGLRDHTALRVLSLRGCDISDAAARVVGTISGLEDLELCVCGLTDAGVANLTALRKIRVLSLRETNLTDAGLVWVAGFDQLRSLNVSKTKISDAGLPRLAGLKHLRGLNMACDGLTQGCLPVVAGFAELTFLNLGFMEVSSDGWGNLAKLSKLTRLYLLPPPTEANGANFMAAVPNCRVNEDTREFD